MNILLISDPGIPVPPTLYGGIERIVFQLANEYCSQGHEVTLLAGPDSRCNGETLTFGINVTNKTKVQKYREMLFAWRYLWHNRKRFDAIHSFGRLQYLLPVLNSNVTKIMSYQRDVTARNIQLLHWLPNKQLRFTGCSNYITTKPGLIGEWHTVYNFVDFSQLPLAASVPDDAPLVFLGRLDKIKGCHNCIAVAKQTGQKLVIAGNISNELHEQQYFQEVIKPQVDGQQIKYIGPVDDAQKANLLNNAKALLMLIDWDEPFGIVMAEAMACGTPVIGFRRGSVPEVVEEGITGCVVENIEEAIVAVNKITRINRMQCRAKAKERFDVSVIAKEYLNLF